MRELATAPVRRPRRPIPLAAFAVLATLAAAPVHAQPAPAPIPAAVGTPVAVPVGIASATRRDVPIELSGLGTVQAYNSVTIRSQVDGQLQQVLFTEGQEVRQGDVLAVVDPRPFQAVLDAARAKAEQDGALLRNAELNLGRDQQLARDDFTSQQTLDNQRAAVAQLKAQLDQDQASIRSAEIQLAYTSITSPVSGRTGVRLVDAGNLVRAADATGIVVVRQMQPISVLSTLPEDDLPRVRAALKAGPVPVAAMLRDGSAALAQGSLSLVDNQIDTTTGTMQLKSTFANLDEALWPGQFVLSRFTIGTLRQALTVPSGAVQRGPDGFFVYVVGAGDRVTPAPVTLGQVGGGIAVVAQGLEDGARVVTSGQYRLVPGARVAAAAPAGN